MTNPVINDKKYYLRMIKGSKLKQLEATSENGFKGTYPRYIALKNEYDVNDLIVLILWWDDSEKKAYYTQIVSGLLHNGLHGIQRDKDTNNIYLTDSSQITSKYLQAYDLEYMLVNAYKDGYEEY